MAHHHQTGPPWALVLLLVIACLLVGYSFASEQQTVSTVPRVMVNDPTLVSLQKTAYVSTPTPLPTATRTPKPDPTSGPQPTPTTVLDFCSVTGLHTPCALPAAPMATATGVPACWVQVTPKPGFVTICQNVDAHGISGESETK